MKGKSIPKHILGKIMQITYIYHSCFLVELENYILLFDYYKGTLPPLNPNKHLLIFVSHKHGDHYSPTIWNLQKTHPHVSYILDQDVEKQEGTSYLQVCPNQVYHAYGIHITTLTSTDEGCAFLLNIEGKTIYHAGDLNWWHWEGEEEHINAWHKQAYLKEIEKLRDQKIDLAFLPFDPRQQTAIAWGMQAILSICSIHHVFPMHFQDDIHIMQTSLQELSFPPSSKIHIIHKEGEQFLIEE